MDENKFISKNKKALKKITPFLLTTEQFNKKNAISLIKQVNDLNENQAAELSEIINEFKGMKKLSKIESSNLLTMQLQLFYLVEKNDSKSTQKLVSKYSSLLKTILSTPMNEKEVQEDVFTEEQLESTCSIDTQKEVDVVLDNKVITKEEEKDFLEEETVACLQATSDVNGSKKNKLLLNGFLNEEFNAIYDFLSEYFRVNNVSSDDVSKLERLFAHKKNVAVHNASVNRFIGPVKFTEDEILIFNKVVQNIPEALYLCENQIIEVDSENNFVKSYNYCCTREHAPKYVYLSGNSAYTNRNNPIKVNGFIFKKYIDPTKPIIAKVDDSNNFVGFEQKLEFDLKNFSKHMKLKGHVPYLFLSELSVGGILAMNLFTKEKEALNISTKGYNPSAESTLIIKDGQIVKVFASPMVYKHSSFNEDKELAVIIEDTDKYVAENLEGEIFTVKFLNDFKPFISIGDTIYVDGERNYLSVVDIPENTDSNITKKVREIKAKKKTISKTEDTSQVSDSVLIIGNINFEHNYKLGLKKFGFVTEVIEGYESEHKIRSAISRHNKIVIVPKFISHNNMFLIKENYPDKEIYYAEKDGASFIGELLTKS